MKIKISIWLSILLSCNSGVSAEGLPNPQSDLSGNAQPHPDMAAAAINQSISPLLGAPPQYSDRLALSLFGTKLPGSPRLGQSQHQPVNPSSYGHSDISEGGYGAILEGADVLGDAQNSSSDAMQLKRNANEKKKPFSVYASPW
jgi:hypothetical protein